MRKIWTDFDPCEPGVLDCKKGFRKGPAGLADIREMSRPGFNLSLVACILLLLDRWNKISSITGNMVYGFRIIVKIDSSGLALGIQQPTGFAHPSLKIAKNTKNGGKM